MTDDERVARLGAELSGCGVQVNGAFQLWALDAHLSDSHLLRIATWADLEVVMVAGCPITDAGLALICCFRRLTSLDIGGTRITANAIAAADLPKTLTTFGLYELPLTDEAANHIGQLTDIQMLNCNGCRLSLQAFHRLAELPRLRSFEALGCPVPDEPWIQEMKLGVAITSFVLVVLASVVIAPIAFDALMGFDRSVQLAFDRLVFGVSLDEANAQLKSDPIRNSAECCLPQGHGFEVEFGRAERSTAIIYYLFKNGTNWYYCLGFDSKGLLVVKTQGHS